MPTLNWLGKEAVENHHKEVPYRSLVRNDDLSHGDANSENIIVEGDNLEALKALLPYYGGKVKCIYIDPPYNTGNENWVYNDNVNAPQIKAWLGKVVGKEGEDLTRHDKWLCMMYPRLMLLKHMLTEDGSIWMSIDDEEGHYLKCLCDEIFGQRNFVADVIWEKSDSPRMDSQFFSVRHDHTIVFAKNIECLKLNRLISDELPSHYNKVDENGVPYYLKPLRAMGGQGDSREARPNLYYPLKSPDDTDIYPVKQDGADGAWRWSSKKVADEIHRIEWVNGKNGWTPYFRIYGDLTKGRPPETIWTHQEVGSNRTSKAEIKTIFSEVKTFDTPKPVDLIKRIIQISTNPNDIILDSFAGSGTTGHAVLSQNVKDKGNRKFILVEMEAEIAQNITSERVRRVANGYVDVKGDSIIGYGGCFSYYNLGGQLFNPNGRIKDGVVYSDLAHYVFYTETGEAIQQMSVKPPLLGLSGNVAVYLLYNGVIADKHPQSGNALTRETLASLPSHTGLRVVYGTSCRLGKARLSDEGIVFKQIPYEIKGL